MDLLKIFKTDSAGIRRSHVKNLITVAMADGALDAEEWDLLVAIAKALGATDSEIQTIREHPDRVNFIPPKKYDDKIQQVTDLVAVMTVDGHINPRELELCRKISLKLDILPRIVDDIAHDLVVTR